MNLSSKVFDLRLLVGRENIMGNRPKIMIESMETSGKNLYIGTSDGTLYHFLILEDVVQENVNNSNTTGSISAFLQNQKRISTKKPITQIEAADELNCLLINSDGSIHAHSMIDLSPVFAIFGRVKNVNKFYVNENPVHANPFALEICVSYVKKKTVQLYQVQENNMIPLKEISLPEQPRTLALDGRHMCVGTSSGYYMVDLDSHARQELIPVSENNLFVHRVAPAEFLLSAPNALGVFVTSAGISQRPPLQWSETVSHATYIHPFVVAMDDEFITIQSVLDQQLKQKLPFQGGIILFKDSNKILVCTSKDIFVMLLIPYEQQISNLLMEDKVEEAMDLGKACRKCMPRQQYQEMMLLMYKKAGFVHFQKLFFEAAEEMFQAGHLDIREIISLYPGVLPDDSTFVRHSPPYHTIPNIHQMCLKNMAKISECEEFLGEFLQKQKLQPLCLNTDSESNPFIENKLQETRNFRSDIFRSSIRIFSHLHLSQALLSLLQGEHEPVSPFVPAKSSLWYEFQSYFEEISQILKDHKCYHVRAMLFLLNNDIDQAMGQWKSLAAGEMLDVDFPGLSFVAECLGRYNTDISLLWKHAEWILSMDENVGVSVFTAHLPQSEESMNNHQKEAHVCCPKIDDVIAFLHHFPNSVVSYLEHLVVVCRIQKEKYHTHLAVLYLERVLKLRDENDRDENSYQKARAKLQALLNKSSMYRVTIILGKVKDTDLYSECVILHGKLGEHEKALDMIVNKMVDQEAAEEYCLTQSSDVDHKKQLFGHLLSVYLSKVSSSSKSSMSAMAVVDLLNKYAENYNAQQVLNVLPKTWSITLLSQFLSRTVRLDMHNARTKQLQHMLERCDNNNVRRGYIETRNKSVQLTEDKMCNVCNRLFQDSDCVVYPNGVAVHPHCGANKYVCPVTGCLFKTLPPPKH